MLEDSIKGARRSRPHMIAPLSYETALSLIESVRSAQSEVANLRKGIAQTAAQFGPAFPAQRHQRPGNVSRWLLDLLPAEQAAESP
jgi:hypothetical protein